MKKRVGILASLVLAAVLALSTSAFAEELTPGKLLGEHDGQRKEWRQKAGALREELKPEIERIRKIHEEAKALREQAAQKRQTLKPLVAEAIKAGNKEKLGALRSIRQEAKEKSDQLKALGAERKELREEIRESVREGDFGQARAAFQILLKVLEEIVEQLTIRGELLENALAVFGR